ncbi:hypothetical protein [Spiroplasma culicicola]|uniref:Transmembrane protein n=1 Tax=Spiroplasma culicicola AES-1 TaxID=1276246 RepID=W6A741_9MOLU|nr:hypothetical protein [Spiroplasma culicicola]AHI52786.1 hypothetical protein SCULI_v1c04450 [Spiroplasma culicicola AES-1]
MARLVDKSEQVTKGGYALGGIWTGSLILGTIFVAVTKPFDFWWILIIISLVSLILFIIHIILTQRILHNIDQEHNITVLQWLSFIQLLTLNFPLFAYGYIGTIFYKKSFYTL